MTNFIFPIHRLNSNITQKLKKVITADILGAIKKGLQNEIFFLDEDSFITNVAEIKGNQTSAQVYLSAAYCQFLWLIDDIALKTTDKQIIEEECIKNGISTTDFQRCTKMVLQSPHIFLNNINAEERFLHYLSQTIGLFEKPNIEQEYNIAQNLLSKKPNPEDFANLNIDGEYEQLTNGVYCYGIAFILLHELSHFNLNHLDKVEETQDEIDADLSSFWAIFNDINKDEIFSANVGIICALFSLLMLNPKMEDDKIHPREDRRILYIYDNIKELNPKYTILVVKLFEMWAKLCNIDNFPDMKEDYNTNIESIRAFLDKW